MTTQQQAIRQLKAMEAIAARLKAIEDHLGMTAAPTPEAAPPRDTPKAKDK